MPSSMNSLLTGLTAIRPAGAYQGTARPQLARTQAEKASDKKAAAERKKTFGRSVRLSSHLPAAAAAPPPTSYAASTAASRAKKLEEQLAREKKQREAVGCSHTTQPTKKKTSSEAHKDPARKGQQHIKASAMKQASSIKKTSQPKAEGSAAAPKTQTTSTKIATVQVAQDTTTPAMKQQSQLEHTTSSEAAVAPRKRRRADSAIFAAPSRFSEFSSDLPDSFSPLRSASDNEHDKPCPNKRVRVMSSVPGLAALEMSAKLAGSLAGESVGNVLGGTSESLVDSKSPSGEESSRFTLKRKTRSPAPELYGNEDENNEDDEPRQIKRLKHTSAVSLSVGAERSTQEIIRDVERTFKSYSNSTVSSRAKARTTTSKSSKEAKSTTSTSGPARKTGAPVDSSIIPATSSGRTPGSSSSRAGRDNEDEAAQPNSLAAVISPVPEVAAPEGTAEGAAIGPYGPICQSWEEVLAEDPDSFSLYRLAPWMGEQTEENKQNFNLKVLQLQPAWNAFLEEGEAAKAAGRAEKGEDQEELWRRFLTRSGGRPPDKDLIGRL